MAALTNNPLEAVVDRYIGRVLDQDLGGSLGFLAARVGRTWTPTAEPVPSALLGETAGAGVVYWTWTSVVARRTQPRDVSTHGAASAAVRSRGMVEVARHIRRLTARTRSA